MFKLLRNLSRIPILVSTRNRNQQHAPIHTVVMLRHGESLWNVENRFTGWCDVPLTPHGEAEAIDAGHLMGDRGIKFDVAFTSNLERAWRTCALALASSGQSSVETIRSSSLNERHYGGKRYNQVVQQVHSGTSLPRFCDFPSFTRTAEELAAAHRRVR
jgi:broad specificity phosphatase PhoE